MNGRLTRQSLSSPVYFSKIPEPEPLSLLLIPSAAESLVFRSDVPERRAMRMILLCLLDCALGNFRSRVVRQLEVIVLRHQLEVLQRTGRARVRLTRLDRIPWAALYRLWPRCLDAVVIVRLATVIAWHRKGFRAFRAWKSRRRRRGRPPIPAEVRTLIRRVTRENPLWSAPRVRGELFKLGIEISQAAVSKYMIRHPKPPSPTWRTFLRNHVGCLASVDFFVVPTATFQLLFVFIVLHHERRRILHFGVTAHPTSEWASQQVRKAFPWETAPRYLIRDRDASYGTMFRSRLQAFGVNEVLTAP